MIKLDNVKVSGLDVAVRGMRNPMNSWDKSDSYFTYIEDDITLDTAEFEYFVGDNDLDLMKKLVKSGTDHRKFMRMIVVTMDITAPLYWWKEFDTYKVGTVANSCSTMHKIHSKEFTLDDFSHEHLEEFICEGNRYNPVKCLNNTIHNLNFYRDRFITTKDRKYWWQMIQLLPSSYNQKRTVMLNYEVLANLYKVRKNHKLDEWRTFCYKMENLPYNELFTGDN